jgi:hypothetical protein
LATQVIGSYAINDLLPIQARQAGTVAFGPFSVPAGYTSLGLTFDLQQVSSLTAVLSGFVEISFDGGTNWQTVGDFALDLAVSGYRLVSGQLLRALDDPMGPGPVRFFGQNVRLGNSHLTTRRVRGSISSSEAVTSGVTLVGS